MISGPFWTTLNDPMGSKSDSQQSTQSTSQQQLDPQIKGALLGNYADAQSLVANTPSQYTGQLVAPMNDTQTAGNTALANIATSGTGMAALNQGIGAAGQVAGFQPSQVQAGQLAGTDLSPYLNPYTQDVVNTTMANLNQQNQVADNANNASATSAGAFGGDRSAVQNALTNQQYALTGAQTYAGLNQANYSNAQQSALADIAAKQAASTSNQSAGIAGAGLNLNAGNSLAAMSGQQVSQGTALANLIRTVGAQQQQQSQNVLSANQGQFQTNLGNKVTMQQLINQALGLAGNPVLGTSQSSGQGTSSGFSLAPQDLALLGG